MFNRLACCKLPETAHLQAMIVDTCKENIMYILHVYRIPKATEKRLAYVYLPSSKSLMRIKGYKYIYNVAIFWFFVFFFSDVAAYAYFAYNITSTVPIKNAPANPVNTCYNQSRNESMHICQNHPPPLLPSQGR